MVIRRTCTRVALDTLTVVPPLRRQDVRQAAPRECKRRLCGGPVGGATGLQYKARLDFKPGFREFNLMMLTTAAHAAAKSRRQRGLDRMPSSCIS